MNQPFQIVPYSPEYEEALLELERMSPQGTLIKLQREQQHFHSRASVFEDYRSFVALGQNGFPVACAIGAQVPISIDGTVSMAGFGFNVRVVPRYRNMGLGQELAKHLAAHYFDPKKLQPQLTIIRTSNMPVLKLLSKSYRTTFQHEFTYLTFSTARGLKVEQVKGPEPKFHVDLLSCHKRLTDYYQMTESGLGIWKTYKQYQLRISAIGPLARAGLWMGNMLKYNTSVLHEPDAILKMVTVFNVNRTNIHTLPAVALRLYKEGVHYMQVCCQQDDIVYASLHKKAINVSSNFLISTREIKPQDQLILDIRCV